MGKLELKNPSKKAEKVFVDDARRFTPLSFEVTALQFELRQHFPRRCTIDITLSRISFLNREDKNIGSPEEPFPEVPRWYKFNSNRFDLDKFEWRQVEKCKKEGNDFISFSLYYDGNKPWSTQQNFVDYMSKLNYLESLMAEVSPFVKRYILVINRSYSFARLNDPNDLWRGVKL